MPSGSVSVHDGLLLQDAQSSQLDQVASGREFGVIGTC